MTLECGREAPALPSDSEQSVDGEYGENNKRGTAARPHSRVTLIDSPVANVASIERALRRVGAKLDVVADPTKIAAAKKIVLPGVGSFAAAMLWLNARGVAAALREAVTNGAELLGICVGFQVLFDEGEEMGRVPGLGFLRGRVRRFDTTLPIPQIGWNRVASNAALFRGAEDASFYFVHSYVADGVQKHVAIANATYGEPFTAAVKQGNVCGVQFHPEKSSTAGLQVLRNFVEGVG